MVDEAEDRFLGMDTVDLEHRQVLGLMELKLVSGTFLVAFFLLFFNSFSILSFSFFRSEISAFCFLEFSTRLSIFDSSL